MANRFANKYQFGTETTNGTAVAADTLIVGPEINAVEPDRQPKFHDDSLGVRGRSSRVSFGNYLWNHTLSIPDGYFQILPALFSMLLKGEVSPSEQTADQDDYLWTHNPALTGSNALDSVTLELGDDTQAYEAEYVMAERLRMSGQISQSRDYSPVSLEADLFGRQLTATAFTGAIAVPTVNPIDAKLSRIYIDALFANAGTTEKTNLLRSWDLEIIGGAHPKFTGSANKYYDTHGQSYVEVMLTLMFERNANADTEWDTFRLGTEQAIRLQVDSGVAIGTGDNHTLTLDMWGAYEYVRPIDSEDRGNNIDAVLFRAMYDGTDGDLFDCAVTTNVAAI